MARKFGRFALNEGIKPGASCINLANILIKPGASCINLANILRLS